MTIRVGVAGANGLMGRTVCAAVNADPALSLVAVVDPAFAAGGRGEGEAVVGESPALAGPDFAVVVDARVDVLIDFTVAEAARETLTAAAQAGVHAVVGTTGFDEDDLERFSKLFAASSANCLIAPNFAISAVLMMRFAEQASPYFDTVEIIEMHHDAKVDAPSGTAIATARRVSAASSNWADDPTQHEEYAGSRGGMTPGGIRVHSVRMRGMVAHQEVILGAQGQTLTIRQDSYDRTSFMPGVLLATKAISEHPGLTIGLDAFLDV